MKNKSGLLLVCLSVLLLLTSCRKISAPEYIDVKNVELKTRGLANTSLSADVRMFNPNTANLVFKSGTLDIYIDNRLLGHTDLDSTIHIPKRDTFQIPLKVRVDMNNVLGNAMSLAFKDSVLLRVEGKIKIGRSGVFITRPIRYEQKERLDLF
ncbi:MAG TPA: LEA type 2 family protein [Agriterribacter sp.]|nr:LEA type 2 family protein [Chitinophagaceae bacterium]HRP30388.1 LEA type 2 family protein [Agriterribacter sp.]